MEGLRPHFLPSSLYKSLQNKGYIRLDSKVWSHKAVKEQFGARGY